MAATTPGNPFYSATYLATSGLGPNMVLGMVRQVHPTGSTRTDTDVAPPSVGQIGGAVMLVLNDSGGTLAQGQVVCPKVDETKAHVRKAPTSFHPGGVTGVVVAPSGIANGYYGWVAVDGLWKVLVGTGNATKDLGAIVDGTTAGTATDAAATTGACFGLWRETATSTNLALCTILPRPGSLSAQSS